MFFIDPFLIKLIITSRLLTDNAMANIKNEEKKNNGTQQE